MSVDVPSAEVGWGPRSGGDPDREQHVPSRLVPSAAEPVFSPLPEFSPHQVGFPKFPDEPRPQAQALTILGE